MAFGQVLAAGTALSFTTALIYARHFHQILSKQVKHENIDAAGRRKACDLKELETLPPELITRTGEYRIVHDRDEKELHSAEVFECANADKLFTKLVQRDMTAFSSFPQAWMMRLLAKTTEQKASFSKDHVLSINYAEGDLFCGFYRVVKRDPFKVEIDMEMPHTAGPLHGRLVISIVRTDDRALLRTETLQWATVASKAALPLERAPIRFMHEVASWWLLVTGTAFLQSLSLENVA